LVLAKIIHVLGTGKTFRHLYKNDRILFKEVLISSGEILQTIICSSYDYKSNEIKKKKQITIHLGPKQRNIWYIIEISIYFNNISYIWQRPFGAPRYLPLGQFIKRTK
jgi:hypothetical protein